MRTAGCGPSWRCAAAGPAHPSGRRSRRRLSGSSSRRGPLGCSGGPHGRLLKAELLAVQGGPGGPNRGAAARGGDPRALPRLSGRQVGLLRSLDVQQSSEVSNEAAALRAELARSAAEPARLTRGSEKALIGTLRANHETQLSALRGMMDDAVSRSQQLRPARPGGPAAAGAGGRGGRPGQAGERAQAAVGRVGGREGESERSACPAAEPTGGRCRLGA